MRTLLLLLLMTTTSLASEIKTFEINSEEERFVGTLVEPKSCSNMQCPGLVIWQGSASGHKPPVDLATHYAREGFSTLAVQYFTAKKENEKSYLPHLNYMVPLETFEKAILWLYERNKRPVSILGGSRGGEAALLVGSVLASELKGKLKSIVAHRPSSHVWSSRVTGMGIPANKIRQERSSWTFRGKEIDYISFEKQRNNFEFCEQKSDLKVSSHSLADAIGRCHRRDKDGVELIVLAFSRAFTFLLNNTAKEDLEAARIKVENIDVPIFVSGGGDDQIWPVARMSEDIKKYRKNNDDFFIIIPGAGHLNRFPKEDRNKGTELGPYKLNYLTDGSVSSPIKKTIFISGGSENRNLAADEIIWKKTIKFLNQ